MKYMITKREYVKEKLILDFFSEINKTDIRYVLIKNMNQELPKRLKNGKDIDILVHQNDKELFGSFMENNNFMRQCPPLGKQNGWTFAYQLPEYDFWKKNDFSCDFFVDACFKLSCKSLTPNTWIPLEQSIQDDIWEQRVFDAEDHWWRMDDKTLLVYLICRAIFDKKNFEPYKHEIEMRMHYIEDVSVNEKMKKIFFSFSDKLTVLLKARRYTEIIGAYLRFVDY